MTTAIRMMTTTTIRMISAATETSSKPGRERQPQQDRQERGDRTERQDRGERPDRSERNERRERPARAEQQPKPTFDADAPQPVIEGLPAEVVSSQETPDADSAPRPAPRRRGRPKRVRSEDCW